jgi:hypothetical protein
MSDRENALFTRAEADLQHRRRMELIERGRADENGGFNERHLLLAEDESGVPSSVRDAVIGAAWDTSAPPEAS